MLAADSESAPGNAVEIYAEFLRQFPGNNDAEFHRLCLAHPHLADELRALRSHSATVGIGPAAEPEPTVFDSAAQSTVELTGDSRTYEVIEQIGRGGMGIVYRVWDARLNRQLAMKRLLKDERQDTTAAQRRAVNSDALSRFVREAELTARLDHPGVVPIHDIGTDAAGRLFFTMRLVEGKRLDQVYEESRAGGGSWSNTRILDVIVKLCETLAFAHSKGIIHRDLKPENIMVGPFGETYVMDWGLAKSIRETGDRETVTSGSVPVNLDDATPGDAWATSTEETGTHVETMAGSVLGTASFMSPEQAAGRISEVDERTDIYAVGGMLYQLLTGRRPYVSWDCRNSAEIVAAVLSKAPHPVHSLNPRAPGELVAICDKAMARDKSVRYQTMLEMAGDLRAFLENRVVKAYRTGAAAELKKWVVRNRGLAASSALAVLVALGGLSTIVGLQSSANRQLKSLNEQLSERSAQIAKQNDELVDANIRNRQLMAETGRALEEEQIARQFAESERNRTQASVLARESANVVGTNPGQALLLALESLHTMATFAGRTALWSALEEQHERQCRHTHRRGVLTLAVSPAGTTIATGSDDETIIIWESAGLVPRYLLAAHQNVVSHLQFSPDGGQLASGSRDHTVLLWNPATGELLTRLERLESPVRSLCYSPDGRWLAVGSSAGFVRIFSTQVVPAGEDTGVLEQPPPVLTLRAHAQSVEQLAFVNDGRVLISGSLDGSLQFRDSQTGELLAEDSTSSAGIMNLQVSLDGRGLLTFHRDSADPNSGVPSSETGSVETAHRLVRLWNPLTRSVVHELAHDSRIRSAAFSRDGSMVFVGTDDGNLSCWDSTSGRLQSRELLASTPLRRLRHSPDGRWLVGLRTDGAIAVSDRHRGTIATLRGHTDQIHDVAFLSGELIATVSRDRTLRLWNLRPPGLIDIPRVDQEMALRIEISPDEATATIRTGGQLQLCRFPSGDFVATLNNDHATFSERFGPDGQVVAALDTAGTVCSWSAVDGRSLQRLKPMEPLNSFRFLGPTEIVANTADGRVVAWNPVTGVTEILLEFPSQDRITLSADGTCAWVWSQARAEATIWDTRSRKQLGQTEVPRDPQLDLGTLDLSHDGHTAVMSRSGAASLFCLDTGRFVPDLNDTILQARGVVYTRDNRLVYTAGLDASCHQFDAQTGDLKVTFSGHETSAYHVYPSPDGQRVILTSFEKQTRLWNARSGTSLVLLGDADADIQIVEFSPDSTLVATVPARGNEVTLWNPQTGERVARREFTGSPVKALRFAPGSGYLATIQANGAAHFWPIGSGPSQPRLDYRKLTPDERDFFEVGGPEQRRNFRRADEFEALADWLVLASRSPGVLSFERQSSSSAVDSIVEEYAAGLAQQMSREAVRQRLKELEDRLAVHGEISSPVLAAFAAALERFDDLHHAAALLTAVLERGDFSTPSLQSAWVALGLGPLHRSPQALLEEWNRLAPPGGDDVRWLLECLSEGKPLRINAGGDQYTAADGTGWWRDCFAGGGFIFGETIGQPSVAAIEIQQTPDQRLYQTERWFENGDLAEKRGYQIPLAPGEYRVVIHFAEIWHQPPENRIFDVLAENVVQPNCHFESLQAGFAVPIQQEFTIRVDDSRLNLEFRASNLSPKVSAIEVHPLNP